MPSQNSTDWFGLHFGASGLTLTFKLRKQGGTATVVAPTVVDEGDGTYTIKPLAAHRDTVGQNLWVATGGGDERPYAEQVTDGVNVKTIADETVTATATVNADLIANLDATVSSRNAVTPNTVVPDNAGILAAITARPSAASIATAVRGELTTELAYLDEAISAPKTLTSAERSTLAGVLDLALINAADGADLIGALADAIAADWVAGDQSPLAIVSAMLADATITTLIADAAAGKTAAETMVARLTADRALKLDLDLAHSGAAATYQADVSSLLSVAAFNASIPSNFGDMAISAGTGLVTTSNPAAGESGNTYNNTYLSNSGGAR